MGKMQNALFMTAALEIVMTIFYYPTQADGGPGTTSLLEWILDPSKFETGNFFSIFSVNLFTALAVVGTTAVLIVGLYYIRNDFIFYVLIAGIFVTFGAVIYQFFNWIEGSLGFAGDSSSMIASMIVAPLLIYYMMTISDFARGRD